MNDLILGLDIGVASVGYGVINGQTGQVVDAGVRLFNSAAAVENVERRTARGSRRLTRRKQHRRYRVKQLLLAAGLHEPDTRDVYNPYALRVKGLSEQLDATELYVALFHLAKRRGISYLEDVDETDMKGDLKLNKTLSEKQLPCEIQFERLKKYGKVRGIIEVDDEETERQHLVNIFETNHYQKEAATILTTQKKYYPTINDEFILHYCDILIGKRKYYHGPGSEKSRTDYGRFKTDGTTLDNFFEALIGSCSIYPAEIRAAKSSYTAQEFNLLNDLNNLRISAIEDGKLTQAQKEKIINIIKTKEIFGSAKMLKLIADTVGCAVDEIAGFRIDRKNKPEFHTFEVYRKISKALQNIDGIDSVSLSREIYDKLAHILTINTDASEIRAQITEHLPQLARTEVIDSFIALKKKGTFSGWHSLSLRAMNEMILELSASSKNQMQMLHERNIVKDYKTKFQSCTYIPIKEVLTEIYNPIAARSIRQALKIVNEILKQYKDLSSIVIEMPRDYISTDEERKQLKAFQAKNEDEKSDAIKRAKEEYNFSEEVFAGHKELMLKLRLWYQQNQRCIYSGKTISVKDLVHNKNMFEIDHIIPESISADDGQNNKVLCYAGENQVKLQQSPFQYYKNKTGGWDFNQYKSFVLSLYNDGKGTISKTKKDLLLLEDDINKWEVRQGFIARNLVDTRYASKVVLNTLQDFFTARQQTTQVKVVRGKFVAQQRRKWNIKKDRDESYAHHAIDALIIAGIDRMKLWGKGSFYELTQTTYSYDANTGEVLPIMSKDEFLERTNKTPFVHFKQQLRDITDNIKYSHMVSKKPNRKISDATIYSTRMVENDTEYVVRKVSNIYDEKSYVTFKKIYDKNKTDFLMYRHNPETFSVLESIISMYPDAKNPFAMYQAEFGVIRKYSKKGNGAPIHNLKYLATRLYANSPHLDITHKSNSQDTNKKRVVLLSVNPFRADVFFDVVKKQFRIIGVKYAAFDFAKAGQYRINAVKYREILKKEEIDDNNHKFLYSFYKDDIIEFGNEQDGTQMFRFLSKNESANAKNRIEVKPIDAPKFEQRQGIMTITQKTTIVRKYTTDVLGNMFLAPLENDPREKSMQLSLTNENIERIMIDK